NEAAHAPGPGAQRAPVFRTAWLAAVGQTDNAFAQPAVIPLNASRVDFAVAPAIVERLLGPRARAASAAAAKSAPALQDDRRPARGILGHREARPNRDLDLGKGAVVDVAGQRLGHRRDAAAFALDSAGDFPLHLGDVLGNSTIDLALKILDDLRAPLRPLIR